MYCYFLLCLAVLFVCYLYLFWVLQKYHSRSTCGAPDLCLCLLTCAPVNRKSHPPTHTQRLQDTLKTCQVMPRLLLRRAEQPQRNPTHTWPQCSENSSDVFNLSDETVSTPDSRALAYTQRRASVTQRARRNPARNALGNVLCNA